MEEIESMIKKSNAFLWVQVGLDLLFSILFFNGWLVKASIGDVQVPEEEWAMLNTCNTFRVSTNSCMKRQSKPLFSLLKIV